MEGEYGVDHKVTLFSLFKCKLIGLEIGQKSKPNSYMENPRNLWDFLTFTYIA